MKITLISPEKAEILRKIYEEHPALVLQNVGYQYINPNKLSTEDKEQLDVVNAILREHIAGFSKFNNFRLDKKKYRETPEIVLRFQYNYGHGGEGIPFTGVGYITLRELAEGFDSTEN